MCDAVMAGGMQKSAPSCQRPLPVIQQQKPRLILACARGTATRPAGYHALVSTPVSTAAAMLTWSRRHLQRLELAHRRQIIAE
jgi:hypothetical protein